MGIFEKVGGTITSTSKGMADKAKSISDLNKIRKQIFDEEEKVKGIYAEIGKKYFAEVGDNPDPKYSKLFADANFYNGIITNLKQQFNTMKGVKVCENCGAEVNVNFAFCGLCGAKLPESSDDFSYEELLAVKEEAPAAPVHTSTAATAAKPAKA